VLVALVVAVAVATRSWLPVGLGALAAALVARPRFAGLVLALGAAGVVRADAASAGLVPRELGPYTGWVAVVADPQPAGGATRLVVAVEGQRYEVWVRGPARSARAAGLRSGDLVAMAGERLALAPGRAVRLRSQHVVGEIEPAWLGDVRSGGALARSANRVRIVIATGAGHLAPDTGALVRGLVIGDDRDQPREMIERFRASGLSHLTAVSGQNVALTVAAAGPLLRRAGALARWVLTIGLIAWFVVVTRAEPSVLRAGTMAALGATAFALGRPRQPARLLAIAVAGLLVVDPLLVWSIGFWLSVGATGGVVALGPWLADRLTGLGPLALPVGITLGAQAGVALPSLLVFGRLSLVGTVANLLAVPVAGFVMLVGLPACLVAGTVPAVGPLVMAPIGVAARWIDAVATVGAALEPSGPALVAGWLALAVTVVALVTVGGRSRRAFESPTLRESTAP